MGSSPTSSVIFLTILLVASFGVEISAKRGCSAFGHSCYGGHGKRSYPENAELEVGRNKEEIQLDYDMARPNAESVPLVPSQGFNRQEQQHSPNSLHDRGSLNPWSLFMRKLMVLFPRQYATYPKTQK